MATNAIPPEMQSLSLLTSLAEFSGLVKQESSLHDLLSVALERGISALEAGAGVAYLPSPDGRYLTANTRLVLPSAPQMHAVTAASSRLDTRIAPDVAGRALLSAQILWVEDYAAENPVTHPRLSVVPAPFSAAVVAVPVIIYGNVAAVLEFFFTEPATRNETAIAFLTGLAHCISLGLLRCYMKETLTLQQEKFKRNMEEKIRTVLEAKSKAEEAARGKTEFLANVSHELRTPMHAILSYSDLALKKLRHDNPEKMQKYLTAIRESGNRLLLLLNELLDISKLEANAMRLDFGEHDVRELVHSVSTEIWPLLRNKKLTLDIIEAPEVITVAEIDPFRIQQVLLNLLSNATKYSPAGETITITFEPREWKDSAGITPALAVLVVDQGIGLPPGEEEAVFEKFTQSSKTKTGAGGTGLGLAICKEIIRAHNGIIYAENNMAAGSTFAFEIPLKQPEVCWLPENGRPIP